MITVTRETTAGPDEVWAVTTDIEGSVDVLSGVTEVERLDDGEGFAPGLRWRETRVLFGREASEVLEVTAVHEGRSYVVEADSGGVHYRSEVRVEPDGTGAVITMTFDAVQDEASIGRLKRFVQRTAGRAMESATRKALQQDLDDIVAAAEARSTGVT